MSQDMPPLPEFEFREDVARGGGGNAGRWGWGEVIAWVVIVVLVGLVAYRVHAGKHVGGVEEDGNAFQMELTARYVVGAKDVLGAGGGNLRKELLGSFDIAARSPRDKLRAAVVGGEFEGAEEMGKRLEAVKEKHPELRKEAEGLELLSQQKTLAKSGDREKLREIYGWIADLAETQGRPASDPKRAAVLSGARRTVVGMIGLVGLIGVGVLLGFVLAVIAIVQVVRGKIGPAFRRGTSSRGVYAEGFAWFLLVYVGGSMGLRAMGLGGMWTTLLLPVGFVIAMGWPLLRGESAAEWRSALGLSWGKGILREVLAGVGGYLAGLPLMVVGVVMTLILMKVTGEQTGHPIVKELSGPSGVKAGLFLLAAVWAPITEELLFRGALYASVRQRVGPIFSAVIVGILFAAIHPQGIAAIPVLASLAIAFALMREWRQSIIAPMVGHALNNGVVVLMMILMIG